PSAPSQYVFGVLPESSSPASGRPPSEGRAAAPKAPESGSMVVSRGRSLGASSGPNPCGTTGPSSPFEVAQAKGPAAAIIPKAALANEAVGTSVLVALRRTRAALHGERDFFVIAAVI